MNYNFSEIVPRLGTDCMKYDKVDWCCGNKDAIPMWVADMDFRTPPFVLEAMQHRMQQGILGYTCSHDAYWDNICRWNHEQFGIDLKREEVTYIPGVVCGIYLCVQCFTEPSDKILIQEPVYHPFRIVPEHSGRQIVFNSLVRTNDSFTMDMDSLRRDIKGECGMQVCIVGTECAYVPQEVSITMLYEEWGLPTTARRYNTQYKVLRDTSCKTPPN